MQEVGIMCMLEEHPHIIRLKQVLYAPQRLYIITGNLQCTYDNDFDRHLLQAHTVNLGCEPCGHDAIPLLTSMEVRCDCMMASFLVSFRFFGQQCQSAGFSLPAYAMCSCELRCLSAEQAEQCKLGLASNLNHSAKVMPILQAT